MRAALQLEGICVERDGHTLLENVNLRIDHGTILALTGPSGSGKTTLLRTIVGLDAPSDGQITMNGRIFSVAKQIVVRPEEREMAMVFQDLGLWPHMSVAEHLRFVLAATHVSKRERSSLIDEMLASVGLKGREAQRPSTLSGGERQRLAIARALITRPSLVLLDEPLSNLDVVLKQELIELLSHLLDSRKATAIFVTHDPGEALKLTSDFAVLERGRIVQSGSIAQMASSPATPFVQALVTVPLRQNPRR